MDGFVGCRGDATPSPDLYYPRMRKTEEIVQSSPPSLSSSAAPYPQFVITLQTIYINQGMNFLQLLLVELQSLSWKGGKETGGEGGQDASELTRSRKWNR